MAHYRLLDKTFINGILRDKGEVVEYDGQPGSTLQPVETKSKVDIPEDWRDQNGLQRIALARSLGAPKQRLSAADADLWISNELENRELAKTYKPAPTPAVKSSTSFSLGGGSTTASTTTPEPAKVVPSTPPSTPST